MLLNYLKLLPKIEPVQRYGDHKSGSLSPMLSLQDIENILGFAPNLIGDTEKGQYEWGFTVDGERCGIWDYTDIRWSTFGSHEALTKLFGDSYKAGAI